jgi:hypothetical protein
VLLQAAEKLVQAVILSGSEGSGFEFSSDYRFFVACWLLRMTVLGRFSAACLMASAAARAETFLFSFSLLDLGCGLL